MPEREDLLNNIKLIEAVVKNDASICQGQVNLKTINLDAFKDFVGDNGLTAFLYSASQKEEFSGLKKFLIFFLTQSYYKISLSKIT